MAAAGGHHRADRVDPPSGCAVGGEEGGGQARRHEGSRRRDVENGPLAVVDVEDGQTLWTSPPERYGLPATLSDDERRAGRLADGHKAVRQLTRADRKLTRRGFGPWARTYRSAEGAKRSCVQLRIPGSTAAPGTTDDARVRDITQALTPRGWTTSSPPATWEWSSPASNGSTSTCSSTCGRTRSKMSDFLTLRCHKGSRTLVR